MRLLGLVTAEGRALLLLGQEPTAPRGLVPVTGVNWD